MRLIFYNGIANFGDMLNRRLFPRLFPELPWGVHDETHFVGIGSILDERLNYDGKSIIFGSGARSFDRLPDFNRGEWDISFVRGPLTAKAVGAEYITDAAYAFALLDPRTVCKRNRVAFVPHFATADQDGDVWSDICAELDILYIDPMAPLDVIMRQIAGSNLVIAEAMHGAIFADMNRIAWIPVRALASYLEGPVHEFKWADWTSSLNLEVEHYQLPVFWPGRGPVSKAKNLAKYHIARNSLKKLLEVQPVLSDKCIFDQKIEQLRESVEDIRKRYGKKPATHEEAVM